MTEFGAEDVVTRLRELPAMAPVFELIAGGEVGRLAVVGGAVRDLARGQAPVDVDLVTEGPVGPLADRLGDTVRRHAEFETATVRLANGAQIDIARARTEIYPAPGALPVVQPASLEVDLVRRDFTVNAIAVELPGARSSAVLAVPGALEDLERGRLAVLHKRSFIDDPTRLFRLARYQGRLGYTVAPGTRALALDATGGGALKTISGARIGQELMLIAGERDPSAPLRAFGDLELGEPLGVALGLRKGEARQISFAATDQRVLEVATATLPADGRPDLVALAVLVRRVDGERLRRALDGLGWTAADRDTVIAAARNAASLAGALQQILRPSEIDRVLSDQRLESVALAAALADEPGRERAQLWLAELRHRTLAIDGSDLLAAGLEPGPAIGTGLHAARAALLDGQAPDRTTQLAAARAGIER